MSKKLRMDAYYYFFEETGCLLVDEILSAVATAGKCYHHTEDWNEHDDGELSPIEEIQNAAGFAAKRIKELEEAMREVVDFYEDQNPNDIIIFSDHIINRFKQLLEEK